MNNYWLKYHMSEIGDSGYYNGVKDGIYLYAHYRDGTMYVGTTGTTYKEAIEEIEAAHKFVNREGKLGVKGYE